MTRNTLLENIQLALTDVGLELFSSDDLTDSLQDGYDEICAYSEVRESYQTIDFVSNLTYYDFSSLLTDYLRTIAIYNNNTNRWLDPVNLKELRAIDEKWETITGQPDSFWPINYKYVALYPRLSSASGTMTIFYKKVADTLAAGSELAIPDEMSEVCEYFVISDLLDQYEEYNKSERFFKEYQLKLEELRKLIGKRTLPDMVQFLREQ